MKNEFKFIVSLPIKGIDNLVTFGFIAHNSSDTALIPGYKVHTFEPDSSFHLENNVIDGITFQFSDKSTLPEWLKVDIDLLQKLNKVILERWPEELSCS